MLYVLARMLLISVLAYAAAWPLYKAEHAQIMQWLHYSDCTLHISYSLAVYGICILISLFGCVPAVSAVKKILPQALAR